jgi:hypothetical protein
LQGITAAATIVIPLVSLNAMAVARKVENKFPQFKQRLLTLTERAHSHAADPFLPLIAENTLVIARETRPKDLVRTRTILSAASVGCAAGLLLVWLVLSSRGVIANEARALWTGTSEFAIELTPVRKTVLRGSAVTVSGRLTGFKSNETDLLVRYSGTATWKTVSMLPGSDSSEFVFEFPRMSVGAEFYAEAEGIRSGISTIKTIDLPRVQHIEASYGETRTDGDIVAPSGTLAKLKIETDRPVKAGELVVEPGNSVDLAAGRDNSASASLNVMRDGRYHVSVRYGNELVQISDEHEIQVPVADKTRPRPPRPVIVHAGPFPAGYEQAVAFYYKRLSELQNEAPPRR